jgi:plasmid stabilization system protein ParE
MNYRVRILARAMRDYEGFYDWIAERSPEGAERWAASFEAAKTRLAMNPLAAPIASESEDVGVEIRHVLFRTRAGRTYRALFIIEGDEVQILRIRGSGQPPVTPDDING